jgi:hypothetical protein
MKAKHLYKTEQVGALVPGVTGKGGVVSVHSSAVNIRRPDGLLVAIVEKFSQMTSLSFTAPDLFHVSGRLWSSILPGDTVDFGKDTLFLGELSFDLKTGKGWSGILHSKQRHLLTLPRLSLLKEALLHVGKEEGLLGLVGDQKDLNPFARRASAVLSASSFEGGAGSGLKGLPFLIGLGPGFTPSGDDFITGALAAERLSRNSGRPFPEIDKGELRKSLHKTNDGGRTLLWQALQGHFPCCLLEALKPISKAGDSRGLEQVLAPVVAHGETSGTDLMAGLIWYRERFARS